MEGIEILTARQFLDRLAAVSPEVNDAFEWPRVQTMHFHGSFWPHTAGFNKLNLEATIPEDVFQALLSKGS